MALARRQSLTVLSVLSLFCALVTAVLEVPARNTFLVREKSAATVIGDYVYVDGGELSQWSVNRVREGIPAEYTLSIDISRSWSTSDAPIRSFLKTGPQKSGLSLWTDSQAGEFYSWGGQFPAGLSDNITAPALWKFKVDGKGGGEWSKVRAANEGAFQAIRSTQLSATANTDNTAFIIGGQVDRFAEPNLTAVGQVVGGMVTYNLASRVWTNETDNSPFKTLVGASAHFLPGVGSNGLIMLLGGLSPGRVGMMDGTAPASDLYNLTFFDPETKKVYWQTTTGEIPPTPRMQACTAMIKSPDGGYEIFISGGINLRDLLTYQDAYMLSLPGFVWRKVPDIPYSARGDATCVQIGPRHVLSMFGKDIWGLTQDPAPNGMLIFDLVAMQWRDSYDATAGEYERPSDLKTWYNNGSFDKVKWSSNEMKRLFAIRTPSPTSSTTGNPGSTPTNTPGTQPSPTGEPETSSPTPVGAIAGGVIGGVAGLALIAITIWFFLRRRKGGSSAGTDPTLDGTDGPGDDKYLHIPGTEAPRGPTELSSPRSPVEADSHGMRGDMRHQGVDPTSHTYYEMDPQAPYAFHEMDSRPPAAEMDNTSRGGWRQFGGRT
ncbi:uncharacterized protein C8A04DRAFT_33588 [Dichotomopilus funicola]|uniref:Kelch repeat protein n=1 Tax=Dichotomopilus funicola TaxID=1934379 RepID=A0AAN6VB51_9PEZI|nr:hypothetical protein C8A04DRAFT_33588 [Dichotomopilus funicola]